jgi:hypothetical protein
LRATTFDYKTRLYLLLGWRIAFLQKSLKPLEKGTFSHRFLSWISGQVFQGKAIFDVRLKSNKKI